MLKDATVSSILQIKDPLEMTPKVTSNLACVDELLDVQKFELLVYFLRVSLERAAKK